MADILTRAWEAYGDPRTISDVEHVRTYVSTNKVYRLHLSDGLAVIAKVSSYGSYYLFREDHDRIHLWYKLLQNTYYSDLLADAFVKDERIYTFYDDDSWVIFYREAKAKDRLPRILSSDQIVCLGREMAFLHRECARLAPVMPLMSKTIKSDIVYLLEMLSEPNSARQFHLQAAGLEFLRGQCHAFLSALDSMRYDYWQKIPVLIDWNISNFSVEFDPRGEKFTLFSRWDYDWFRMEPRGLDFYFFSRVVRSEGDQTAFTYSPDPLLETRFIDFMRAYHQVFPLEERELLFLKEAYRFFLLNYVIKDGLHFFQDIYYQPLLKEAIHEHLPRLDQLDFGRLVGAVMS